MQDHCEAVDLVLRKGESGDIYNISAGNELPNVGIVRRILKMLNKTEDLIALADLVTEMKNVKHPFDEGLGPRRGIEY